MKCVINVFLILTMYWMMGIGLSQANTIINFGPREARIDGSIPYSVIGKYRAQFRVFKGRITADDNFQDIKSVNLEIQAGSITSSSLWCDRLARSHRLLNAAKYPKIIFKSLSIIHHEGVYQVKGILAMHGVKRVMTFPFSIKRINRLQADEEILVIQGSWVFNRKDFNIVWNKVLDRGGIIVGDDVTVNWGIKAQIK